MSSSKKINISRIQEIEYPKCSTHRNSQLNQICIQNECILQFQPACFLCYCDNQHTCRQHSIKPIQKVINELDNLIQQDHIPYLNNSVLSDEINLLAKQFKNIGDKCLEISDNILMSANKYKKTVSSLAPEIRGIENIIENIKQDGSAQNMRVNLLQLNQYIKIEQEGGYTIQFRNADKLERVSTRYSQYFQKLEQLYSYIINDLNNAHQNSLFYTGVQFASNPSSDKKGDNIKNCSSVDQQIESNLFIFSINEWQKMNNFNEKGMRVVLESPQKVGMKISDESYFKVKIINRGDQKTYPLTKQKLKINYKVYDEEFNLLDQNKEGSPFIFTLGIGEVIKGWEQAIPEMCLGEKSLIVCHKNLINNSKYNNKYSDQSSSLYFEIEIVDII